MHFKRFLEADERFKYPRTSHLPWTQSKSADDRTLQTVSHFEGKEIVVTEKIDGENTTMYRNYIHARSTSAADHPSRSMVKSMHGAIKADIPEGWRIAGENVYAKHSIAYEELSSYFLVFAIYDDKNFCLSWGDTKEWANLLNLKTVPELYVGPWDEKMLEGFYDNVMQRKSKFGGIAEGYVVRTWDGFPYADFKNHVAKFVRSGHVQTDQHWMAKPVEPNKLGHPLT